MPSGKGRRNRDAEAEGGGAEEGALDEAWTRCRPADGAGAGRRGS